MKPVGRNIHKIESLWKERVKPIIFAAALYTVFHLLGIGCPIKFITGVSCPGCGMTRAIWSAFHLRFSEAFYFHPLFFLVPFMFAFYLFEDYIKPVYVKLFWTIIIITFFAVYFVRLFILKSDIVTFDFPKSSMLKYIKLL